MAVTASALGTHVIRSLDDLLKGRLRKVSSELRDDAVELRRRLADELPYSVDAENRVLEEEHARPWLAELRQMLYKADQIILDADAQAERPSILAPVMRRFSIDKSIKQEIKHLLGSMDSISKNRPPMLRRKNMKKNQQCKSCERICHDNLVGTNIELEIPTLVDKLTEDHDPSQHFIFFVIFGLGGVGKTTIARKIFDDQRTISAFSTRLWVSISKGSSATQLLLATTSAAAGDLKGSKTRDELQNLLAEKIGGRRIFLVFNLYNDVPSNERIGNAEIYGNIIEVLSMFHHAAEESRVLITTSDENVGNEIKSAQIQRATEFYGVQVHRLRQLTVEDGWTLLLKAACLEQAKMTPDLKKIGIGIVQKCNGLPLAIKAVGGVLARKRCGADEWEGIRDSSAFSLKDLTTGTEGGVRSSIYLSYQDALPHLKQCFIYLSLFPPDIEIEKNKIIQLWISEDLIDSRDGQGSEETTGGQNNVWQEESNRQNNTEGITQEQDINLSRDASNGRNIVPLEVIMDDHSIISSEQDRESSAHPLQEIVEDHSSGEPPKGTPSLSSDHCSNGRPNMQTYCSREETADRLFEELVGRGLLQQDSNSKGYKMHEQVRKIAYSLTENEAFAGDPKDVAKLSATLHRLSFVNKGLTTIPEDVRRLSNLRTLLLSGNPLGEKDLDIIFKNLELLRVLELSDTEISSIPKTLGNLVHLRHLNLSGTKIRALPESIGSLRRLRFLGLQKCEYLTLLPKNIQKLLKLEYLNVRDSEITGPPKLQNLRCLTFLHGFVVDSRSSSVRPLDELQNMSKLISLQITIRNIPHRTFARGDVLKKKDNLRNLELSCRTVISETLSRELHPHKCLESLKIDGDYGSACPDWLSFSELPDLQQLDLVNCKFCELPSFCQFKELKFLRISKLSMLQRIDMQPRAGTTSFPNLKELHIEDMPNLESWSEFQATDLPLLRKLSLRRCPKLKHIPSGLEHCKMLETMEVRNADLLQAIENLAVQELFLESMPSLTTVSNFPLLKVLIVTGCPILRKVSGVNSLRHVHIEDKQVDQLPKWLEQHASRIETLDLVGNAELLGRCERNKKDWYIIREIARVHTYFPGRVSFFSYTRSNDLFFKYQRHEAYAHDDPSAPAVVVDQKGASMPASSEATNDSAGESAGAHGTDRKHVEGKFIWALIVGLIFTFCFTFNLDPSEALYLSILFYITVFALFKFF